MILSEATPLGKAIDLGAFPAGAKLSFALKTDDGYTYYTDQVKNPDFLSHVRKLPIGYNKWELRWEASLGLTKKSYKDLVVEIEVMPIIKEDVVLAGRQPCRGQAGQQEYALSQPFLALSAREQDAL